MAMELRTSVYEGEWSDISTEKYRVYEFGEERLPDGRIRPAYLVRIDKPQWLHVSKSGGHRILDIEETSHYIPCGWKHLWWTVQPNAYHFVK